MTRSVSKTCPLARRFCGAAVAVGVLAGAATIAPAPRAAGQEAPSTPVVAVEPPPTSTTVAPPTTQPPTTLDTLPPEQPVTTQPPPTSTTNSTSTTTTSVVPSSQASPLLDPSLAPVCAQIVRPVPLRSGRPCRIIAYYGSPLSTQLGILGRLPRAEVGASIRAEVERWRRADPETDTVCAFEIIAATAQSAPGPSGLYRARISAAALNAMIALARENSCLTILDLQVGWSSVPVELPYFTQWLSQPDVHLALDPEWDMPPGVRPGTKIGSMESGDINNAISVLRQLARTPGADGVIRPKLLVVHRFRDFMIVNPERIVPTPEVRLLMNMDGFGPPQTKLNVYAVVRRGIATELTGFKLFTINDKPMLRPDQVIGLKPAPMFVNYQ